ncbi:MAG TPA: maleylpyruvate isomerase family mycothiol-dependent enzyme [Actinomycetota bacterium]|nr:maleylpyruvate isomerase family mycothiol-dependent enzyme [Actinomycetota bacterium]
MPTKAEIIRAVRDQRRRTLDFVSQLDPEQFEVEALPGWRIREVLAHLISTDRATLTGAILPAVFGSMDKLEAWNERQVHRLAGRPPAELLVGLDRWGRRFARFASALPSPLYRLPLPTLWGRGPGGMLIHGRAYDEWVHRQDMRRGLGQPDEEVDLASVAEFLLGAVRTHTLPQLAGRGGRVAVSLSDVPIAESLFDLGEGTVSADGSADARVVSAGAPFIMTAAGRGTFADLEQAGKLSIEGDRALAESFLKPLRIV